MVMMMKSCKIKAYNGKQQDGKIKKEKEEHNNIRGNGNGVRKEEMKR